MDIAVGGGAHEHKELLAMNEMAVDWKGLR